MSISGPEFDRDAFPFPLVTVDQGFETFSKLAASLTVSDWWCFWWD